MSDDEGPRLTLHRGDGMGEKPRVHFRLVKRGECKHTTLEVDEKLWQVRCALCGDLLDPIAAMAALAKEQRYLEFEVTRLEGVVAKLKGMTRTKCVHCQKFTPIGGYGGVH